MPADASSQLEACYPQPTTPKGRVRVGGADEATCTGKHGSLGQAQPGGVPRGTCLRQREPEPSEEFIGEPEAGEIIVECLSGPREAGEIGGARGRGLGGR